jgi:hypothetical protein
VAHSDVAGVNAWAAVIAAVLSSATEYGRPLVSSLAEKISGCLLGFVFIRYIIYFLMY